MRRFIRPDLQASLASSLFQPFKLKWNIGDRAVETSEDYFFFLEWQRADLTEKLDCLLEIHFHTKLSKK